MSISTSRVVVEGRRHGQLWGRIPNSRSADRPVVAGYKFDHSFRTGKKHASPRPRLRVKPRGQRKELGWDAPNMSTVIMD